VNDVMELQVASCEFRVDQAPSAAARGSQVRHRRRGFSFAEVMFAVIVLGVGFIMVAAIFPVAIQQTKTTADDTHAAAGAREAANNLGQSVGYETDMPALTPIPTGDLPPSTTAVIAGQVYSLRDPQPTGYPNTTYATGGQWLANYFAAQTAPRNDPDWLWKRFRGNVTLPADPRFGLVVLFRRDRSVQTDTNGAPVAGQPITDLDYAQVIMIVTQSRVRSIYSSDPKDGDIDLVKNPPPPANKTAALQPRPVRVVVHNNVPEAGGVDLLAFDTRSAAGVAEQANANAAAEGAYVVIARDNITAPVVTMGAANVVVNRGRMNGRVFRLGAHRPEFDGNTSLFTGLNNSIVFELQPGNDFSPDGGYNGALGHDASGNPITGATAAVKDDDILAIGDTAMFGASKTVASGPADAFVVGRTPVMGQPANTYDGPAQDIALYTTFISLR
jgi:hypothetical protein